MQVVHKLFHGGVDLEVRLPVEGLYLPRQNEVVLVELVEVAKQTGRLNILSSDRIISILKYRVKKSIG